MFWARGDWLELPRSDVTLKEKLGEGAFGEAYKGLVRVNGQCRPCAVKKLKGKFVDTCIPPYTIPADAKEVQETCTRQPGNLKGTYTFTTS